MVSNQERLITRAYLGLLYNQLVDKERRMLDTKGHCFGCDRYRRGNASDLTAQAIEHTKNDCNGPVVLYDTQKFVAVHRGQKFNLGSVDELEPELEE